MYVCMYVCLFYVCIYVYIFHLSIKLKFKKIREEFHQDGCDDRKFLITSKKLITCDSFEICEVFQEVFKRCNEYDMSYYIPMCVLSIYSKLFERIVC